MPSDKRVPARSDAEIRRIAEKAKSELGVSRFRPVNILHYLESESIWTLYGRKKLVFKIQDDETMNDVDAKTEFEKGVVIITCKRSVYQHAKVGVGRDRMTLAHELGHGVLHHSASLFRIVGAAGATDLAKEAAHTSAEHQAKVFASAFLIHDEDAAKMRSANEISEEFGVSLQAAQVCFDRLARKAERQKSAERVRKSADEAIGILKGRPPSATFLNQPCISCKQNTLVQDGTRVRCVTCGFFGDLQDGDKAD